MTAQHARDTRQLADERGQLTHLQSQLQDDRAKFDTHVTVLEENLKASQAEVVRQAQALAAEKERNTAELDATRSEYFQQVETERAALEKAHDALARQKADLATLRDELEAARADIEQQATNALILQEQVCFIVFYRLL